MAKRRTVQFRGNTISIIEARAIVKAYKSKTTEYHTALGAFLDSYAHLESMVATLLRLMSKVPKELAPAIFSGVRVREACGLINRILEAEERQETKVNIKPLFDKISELTSARDELLHYGVGYKLEDHTLTFTNERSAHIPRKLRNYVVDKEMVDDLNHDVTKVLFCLLFMFFEDASVLVPGIEVILQETWRYKPPQLTAHPRKMGQAEK